MEELVKVQEKWREKWEKAGIFESKEDKKKPKKYVLEMYPYPSASGLHIGHAFNYVIGDIYARMKFMQGYNVLHPMGFDSFGLPAENAAIKSNSHPKIFTETSIENYIKQQKRLGITYDWGRKIFSHDPEYYKWDQWIFLQMMKKELVYRKKAPINWCPECKTVLANEQVVNGKCWRHKETNVEIKHLEQWFFKITEYAKELYDKIESLKDWPERIKAMQKNWIGKSEGVEINFEINKKKWAIFTTRPDTIFGVTFMVVSAQHPNLMELVTDNQKKEVESFLKKINTTSEKNMAFLEKDGVFTGSYAINPFTSEKIPVYAGNFVVADYAGGMVMAVPAHDQRDYEFAKKYKIPIKEVIKPENPKKKSENRAYTEEGILINSGQFNGLKNSDAIKKISEYVQKNKLGKKITNYKLRDWLISRQRFWGTPIPVVYCKKCGIVPVPEKELPVKLPEKIKLTPGKNPLAESKEFISTKCPKCGDPAKRETDTMDTFVNSSWYFLRYCDSQNKNEIFKKEKIDYWCPIDLYIGGAEHACMHLIYFRFYTKFLRDLKLLDFDEPAYKLFNQGMVHGEDGFVMSKSRGNVKDPNELMEKYGSDAVRMYLVSVAAPETDFSWNEKGLESVYRFVKRVYSFFKTKKFGKTSKRIESRLNREIKEIEESIENMKYNISVIKIRQLFDEIEKDEISKDDAGKFLKIITPFCPHIAEELWESIGNKAFISKSSWPKSDKTKIDNKEEEKDRIKEELRKDIQSLKDLLKIKEIKKITLIISQEWKYKLVKMIKELMEKTSNPGGIIKEIMKTELKKHGQEIMKIVPNILKNRTRIPKTAIIRKDEMSAIDEIKKPLEAEFKTKIEIKEADSFAHQKSGNAFPGKPAIIME